MDVVLKRLANHGWSGNNKAQGLYDYSQMEDPSLLNRHLLIISDSFMENDDTEIQDFYEVLENLDKDKEVQILKKSKLFQVLVTMTRFYKAVEGEDYDTVADCLDQMFVQKSVALSKGHKLLTCYFYGMNILKSGFYVSVEAA